MATSLREDITQEVTLTRWGNLHCVVTPIGRPNIKEMVANCFPNELHILIGL
jgi:hypothetical protein